MIINTTERIREILKILKNRNGMISSYRDSLCLELNLLFELEELHGRS